MKTIEQTFVMLKPDAVERGLIGEIVARLERKGLKPIRFVWKTLDGELLKKHYAHLADKPYFPEIVAYMTRGSVLASIWEGRDAVAVVRRLVGPTDGGEAEPGTIRGDFALDYRENLVHASDSVDAARREIALFFN